MPLSINVKSNNRLLSLDFMRGLIMVLLALESTEIYGHLRRLIPEHSTAYLVIQQFFHNQWRGLHFWDLIQPAFMFMAGVAMAYSLTRQQKNGYSFKDQFFKIGKRCLLLLFFGIFKRIYQPEWLSLATLDVTDILTQLAFTTFIAFLLFRLPVKWQVLSCFLILLLTELLYRYWSVPGFDQGYVDGHNFGNYMDYLLFGQKSHGYVFVNWLPTAVHSIGGTIVGKLLIEKRRPLLWMLGFGVGSLIMGYGMDITGFTHIIKPIASSSFVLASIGYCLVILATIYWWIDIKKHQKGLVFFLVIGMNSIFIYLLCDILGRNWLNGYIAMIVHPICALFDVSNGWISVLASLCTFMCEWYVCYFLYKKRIFFKV